jgi:hypothetical protein
LWVEQVFNWIVLLSLRLKALVLNQGFLFFGNCDLLVKMMRRFAKFVYYTLKVEIAFCLWFASPLLASELVSKGVGQVAGYVVTSREVVISNIFEQVLLNMSISQADKKSINKSTWLLKTDSQEFQKRLSQVMIEILVKMEAESFSVAQVSGEEIKAESQAIKQELKDWSEWKKLEVSDAEVDQILNRRKMAKNFLKFKTESSGVIISDLEAKNYFEKNRVKFGGAGFPQFKEGIKELLSQQQLEDKLKDWFEILKRKYRVRFLKNDVDKSA